MAAFPHRLVAGLISLVCAGAATPAPVQAQINFRLRVGEPEYYGRIDTRDYARPYLINQRAILVRPQPWGRRVQPIYLRVPPGHARNWNRHCHRYNACSVPVYFVRDDWYRNVVVPRARYRSSYQQDRRWKPDKEGKRQRQDR